MAFPPSVSISSLPATQIPAAAAIAPPQIPSLDNTFGALVVGTFLGLILYGVALHQAYRYVRLYPNDSRGLKSLVVVTLAIETFTSILGMHACYFHLVTNYFLPQTLTHPSWSLNLHPLASGLSMLIAQSFFIRRVWIIGARFRSLVFISAACALTSLVRQASKRLSCLAATTKGLIGDNLQEDNELANLLAASSAIAVVSDLLPASVLIYVLHRSRTGIKSTDSMIDRMIMYSISTGLLTGIVDTVAAVIAFALPQQLLYVAFGIPATKLYANALLVALNSRRHLASYGDSNVVSNEISAFGFAPPPVGCASETYTTQLRRAMRATGDADAPVVIEVAPRGRHVSTETRSTSAASVEDLTASRGTHTGKEAV